MALFNKNFSESANKTIILFILLSFFFLTFSYFLTMKLKYFYRINCKKNKIIEIKIFPDNPIYVLLSKKFDSVF